jgi:two-component system cell cycle sensor histidine kinase/response regulator CckA
METLHTVLIVDDEPMVRDLCRMLLEREGYEVLTAGDGLHAVEIFQDHWRQIGLVVLDWTLPRFSGDEVFRLMIRIDPDVRILFCSGYPPDQIRAIGHPCTFGYLAKPFHNRDFIHTVWNLFGSHVGASAARDSAESATNPY